MLQINSNREDSLRLCSVVCVEKLPTLDFGEAIKFKEDMQMTREELKEQIDELMRQYADEEIDGATYAQRMMELTTAAQNERDED